MDTLLDQPKPPRRRDPAQPTDIAERVFALQRRNAAYVTLSCIDPLALTPMSTSASRARERADRPPPPSSSTSRPPASVPLPSAAIPHSPPTNPSPRKPHATPNVVISRAEADPDDFSRRLKISNSPRSHQLSRQQQSAKLYNPDADPTPMHRTTEPEAISDATSSSNVPRTTPTAHQRDAPTHQRLFDHRKDDPVRFSVLARPSNGKPAPVSKASGDYLSASSTSSYAPSMTSSSFTLSSGTTDNSSASSALFDGARPPREDPSNNAFAIQLKKLYRSISTLESKILNEDSDDNADEGRVLLRGRGREVSEDELEQQKWQRVISDHKRYAYYPQIINVTDLGTLALLT